MQQQWIINNSSQLSMFQAIILPIFRSTRLYIKRFCRLVAGNIVGALYHKL